MKRIAAAAFVLVSGCNGATFRQSGSGADSGGGEDAIPPHTVDLSQASDGAAAAAPDLTMSTVDLCLAYKHLIRFDLPFAGASVVTTPLGAFDDDTVLVGKIVVPANAPMSGAPGRVVVSEYQGPSTPRVATLSTRPCDFRDLEPFPPPRDPTGAAHPMAWSFGTTASVAFVVGAGGGQAVGLTAGQTVYFNVRNYSPDLKAASCGQATCNTIVNLAAAM